MATSAATGTTMRDAPALHRDLRSHWQNGARLMSATPRTVSATTSEVSSSGCTCGSGGLDSSFVLSSKRTASAWAGNGCVVHRGDVARDPQPGRHVFVAAVFGHHGLRVESRPRGCVATVQPADGLWFGIQPISAGVFGVPAGFVAAAVVSRITRPAPVPTGVRLEI